MQHDAGTAQRTAVKAFDYEQFLAGLDQFRVPAHPLPGRGVRLRRWTSGPLQPYNGFSSDERIHMWQLQEWAREAGLYPALGTCVACGARPADIFHSENYADLWNVIRVCRSCHSGIHSRFRHPAAWVRRLALPTPGSASQWLKLLPREPIDVAGWLRAKNVPSFLWPAPRR
jgi:hypothetical protein